MSAGPPRCPVLSALRQPRLAKQLGSLSLHHALSSHAPTPVDQSRLGPHARSLVEARPPALRALLPSEFWQLSLPRISPGNVPSCSTRRVLDRQRHGEQGDPSTRPDADMTQIYAETLTLLGGHLSTLLVAPFLGALAPQPLT